VATQSVVAIPGERLSPSQVRTFLECQAKWAFKYQEGLPEPARASLTLGKAVHAALESNFRQKIESGVDLPVGEVTEFFRGTFEALRPTTEFTDEEDPAGLADSGAAALALYHEQVSPSIRPALVEQRLEREIGGVPVTGVIDLVDCEGLIVDFKTAAKKPSNGVSPDHAFQLATYAALSGQTNARCRVDTLVKTKTPQVIQQEHVVNDSEIRYAGIVYGRVRQSIWDGVFIPNRNSFLCSRKNCAFWRECEREFGGHVRE